MFLRIIIPAVVLAGCSSSGSPTGIEPMECPPTSTLTYENFGAAVMETHCLSCHDTKAPRLLTVEHVRLHADAILEEAVYTDSMPRDATMPLDMRAQLGEWLSCGAP